MSQIETRCHSWFQHRHELPGVLFGLGQAGGADGNDVEPGRADICRVPDGGRQLGQNRQMRLDAGQAQFRDFSLADNPQLCFGLSAVDNQLRVEHFSSNSLSSFIGYAHLAGRVFETCRRDPAWFSRTAKVPVINGSERKPAKGE